MCLVSYVPLPQGKYVVSSNRDESPLRKNVIITEEKIGNFDVTYPKEQKGGSWIFASKQSRHLCLLNGAFENHLLTKKTYNKSRGLMLKDSYQYESFQLFFKNYNFSFIEPFTLIAKDSNYFFEFRWDGRMKFIFILNPQKIHVWSSCTLYDNHVQKIRESFFYEQLQKYKNLTSEDILEIHKSNGPMDNNIGFVMSRNDTVLTTSISQIKHNLNKNSLIYHELNN